MMQYCEGNKYTRLAATQALACLLLANAGSAAEPDLARFELQVQPSICVSYNSDEPCTMQMEVRWEGSDPADVCLRDTLLTPLLRCWQDSARGSMELEYASATDGIYQLVEEASLGILAEAEVKVINRDLRSSRKRRRHVWSIL